MMADPKPGQRVIADREEWERLRRVKLGPCRVCSVQSKFNTLHHLVGRDLAGDDVPNNLVPLCWNCHPMVEERKREACELLRESLTTSELDYVLAKKGDGFLNRYYPAAQATKGMSASHFVSQ